MHPIFVLKNGCDNFSCHMVKKTEDSGTTNNIVDKSRIEDFGMTV
jgi:hypothetical protein